MTLRPLFAGLMLFLAGCAELPGGPDVRQVAPVVADNPLTRAALSESASVFPGRTLPVAGFVWIAPSQIPAAGNIRVLVSIRQQRAWIWRGDKMIGMTMVSTGVAGHPTVPGHWPIQQKARFHRSNKYSNAPMPFMQRLDEYGIALHAGVVPGYPASHGCIRLPAAVAQKLYGLTKLGDPVDIES